LPGQPGRVESRPIAGDRVGQQSRRFPISCAPVPPLLAIERFTSRRNFLPCSRASRTACFTGRFFTSIAIQLKFFCLSGLTQVSKALTSQRTVGGCCTAAADWEAWVRCADCVMAQRSVLSGTLIAANDH
jgi:hypothetical protein